MLKLSNARLISILLSTSRLIFGIFRQVTKLAGRLNPVGNRAALSNKLLELFFQLSHTVCGQSKHFFQHSSQRSCSYCNLNHRKAEVLCCTPSNFSTAASVNCSAAAPVRVLYSYFFAAAVLSLMTIRCGIPMRSASANFSPGRTFLRLSYNIEIPCCVNKEYNWSACLAAASLSPTRTRCTRNGAMFSGQTSPLSSAKFSTITPITLEYRYHMKPNKSGIGC